MKLIKTLKITAGVVAVAVAATFLAPRDVHIERTLATDVDATEVVRLASSSELYQQFNPYKDVDPNLKVEFFGPTSGVGSGFNFDSKDGQGSVVVVDVTETEVHYEFDFGPMGKPTQKIAVEDGTLVWSMDLDMGNNPIGRVMGLFMDGILGPNFESGLTNLVEAAA